MKALIWLRNAMTYGCALLLAAACTDSEESPRGAHDSGAWESAADAASSHPVLDGGVEDAGGSQPALDAAVDAGGGQRPGDAGQPPRSDGGKGSGSDLMCDPENEVPWHDTGASADGQVRFVLDRCAWNACAGGCGIGDVYFALSYQGRTDAAQHAQIAYTTTHHNWNDALLATLSDRILSWRIEVDEADITAHARMFVRVESLTGQSILAETEVFFPH